MEVVAFVAKVPIVEKRTRDAETLRDREYLLLLWAEGEDARAVLDACQPKRT